MTKLGTQFCSLMNELTETNTMLKKETLQNDKYNAILFNKTILKCLFHLFYFVRDKPH